MKHVINLYTKESCPKCKILKEECKNSDIIKNSDFQISVIDVNDKSNTDLQLLIEQGFSVLPVLLVDNTFLDFTKAMSFIRGELEI